MCALAALVLLLWRRAPGAALHAVPPAGAVAVSVILALAEPVGLVPAFYLWPMLVAAYFLPPREVAVNLVFALAACIGEEEFALVLPDTDAAGALVLAQALRERLAAADLTHRVTLSAGVTDRATSGTDATGMLAAADRALYAAKHQGRDRIARAVPVTAAAA
ncbi:MAG TPA: diguanylate cyclase [Solirubrobacteraceae bacterium]|nr:diguanylate cyclase [Solirubrobacteraceae bacterium]